MYRLIKDRTDQFALNTGRRPRILLTGSFAGHGDCVDNLTPSAFSQWGFDVDIHSSGQTHLQTVRTALENDVHAVIFPFHCDNLDASTARAVDLLSYESNGLILSVIWKQAPDLVGGKLAKIDFDKRLSLDHELLPSLSHLLARIEKNERDRQDPQNILKGIVAGDRRWIAKAITLVESHHPEDQLLADQLVAKILPRTGNSLRIGISGVPGAGKSTFIESFGTMLVGMGYSVAVLAVDPTSVMTGGSILGDRIRMKQLSGHPKTYIRPTPSGGSIGGITQNTRKNIIICDAAGFDVILVETIGVGQSETSVASMVDFFMVLLVAGAGDELQGIKKGILEYAHAIIINKADGDNVNHAQEAQKVYQAALSIIQPDSPLWTIPVLICSSLNNKGISGIWQTILDFRTRLDSCGELEKLRHRQSVEWMWTRIEEGLKKRFYEQPNIKIHLSNITDDVKNGRLSPTEAAFKLLEFKE